MSVDYDISLRASDVVSNSDLLHRLARMGYLDEALIGVNPMHTPEPDEAPQTWFTTVNGLRGYAVDERNHPQQLVPDRPDFTPDFTVTLMLQDRDDNASSRAFATRIAAACANFADVALTYDTEVLLAASNESGDLEALAMDAPYLSGLDISGR